MVTAASREPILVARELRVFFGKGPHCARAVDGVSLTICEGETVGLVGESGCGKSVTALALTRLIPEPPGWYAGGEVLWRGRPILGMTSRELRAVRGKEIAYVFQEAADALNPLFPIGSQILESLRHHDPERASGSEVAALLARVGLPAELMHAYPHQLSGGQQQRALIAMALACRPRLLIADEPTTALDVTLQREILSLLADLRKELGMAVLLITHNLGIVNQLAERLYIMYAGQIVEQGPTSEVLRRPAHPYTRALLAAVPRLEQKRSRLVAIPGSVPEAHAWPQGCRFHPRCTLARPDCATQAPALQSFGDGHEAACPYGGK